MDRAFNQLLQKTGEYGIVYQVSHPIVFIDGLPNVKTHEVVMFESGQQGEVFTINRGKIEARTFSHEPVKVGTKVTRTDELLSTPVGDELLGHLINPLGEPLDPTVTYTKPKEYRDIDPKPGGISTRQKITKHLASGTSLVDLMIPLGRGQRELVIGDRKTGKTSFLMTTIKKQTAEGVIAIYAAVAKKKSDIKKLQEFFVQEKIMDRIVIVATSSFDSPSLIYLTPYTAMTIAEYFKEKGQHTLLILDDLSNHAKFYRELSLLARRFPGRDSYPGDIFYVHSRLLERAGNFKHPKVGEISITCLPVIEIVEGDLTSYVSTNVMGITDGHIYFDSNQYYKGMRPAVNIPLSVTRVGRQTLPKLFREINKELTAFLSSYDKLLNLSHFGQELTDDVKRSLLQGDLIYNFFNQPYQLTVPMVVQATILSMIMQSMIVDKRSLEKARAALTKAYEDRAVKNMFDEFAKVTSVKDFNNEVINHKDKLFELGEIQAPPAAATQPTDDQTTPPTATTSQTSTTSTTVKSTTTQQPTTQPTAQTTPPANANAAKQTTPVSQMNMPANGNTNQPNNNQPNTSGQATTNNQQGNVQPINNNPAH